MTRPQGAKSIVTTLRRPDLIDTVADWIWSTFWRPHGYDLAAIRALVQASDAEIGPSQCFVLLVAGQPVGTVGLIGHDLDDRPELTPWLAALYVRPEARGHGYARDLIREVENECVRAGVPELWLHTSTAERLYASQGLRAVDTFSHRSASSVLMHRTFDG